jgi:RNA polymerase sigma-70 factor (ECF subfamily)
VSELSQLEDKALVKMAQDGDARAFRILMERYQRKVYAVALGFLRNQEDALDVVQEAFIKVHRYIGKFEGNSGFYTWLYRIVANLCIDYLRRKKRQRGVEFDDGIRHDQAEAHSGTDLTHMTQLGDPREMLRRKEILDAVTDSLEFLSDKHRAVIVMREFQGMSYEEMAVAMECSKGTIMSRLFHARKNMQKLLGERLGPLFIKAPSPAEEGDAADKKESNKREDPASKTGAKGGASASEREQNPKAEVAAGG